MQQLSLHGVDVQMEIWPRLMANDVPIKEKRNVVIFKTLTLHVSFTLVSALLWTLVCKFLRTEETICCLSESGMCSHSCLIQDLLYFKFRNANIFVWQDRSAGGLFMAPRLLFHSHAKHAECGYCLAAIIKTCLEKESILLAAFAVLKPANQHTCAFWNVQWTNVSP